MSEDVRFVWEGSKRVYFHKAEKLDKWSDMKHRLQCIKESIEDAKKLLDKMRKAKEFGVLTTAVYWDLGSKTSFKYIEHENAELTFTIKAPYNNRENIKEEIIADPIKAIEEFINDLENELAKHINYMKEAEPYLCISVNL